MLAKVGYQKVKGYTMIMKKMRKKVRLLTLLAVSAVVFVFTFGFGGGDPVLPVSAADGDPIYMKIEGIDGEATDRGHENEIDVLSWSWGMSQSSAGHAAGSSRSGKVSVHDISITKHVDKSSADLMIACASGRHFPNIILTMRKASEEPRDYLKYMFENVYCTSYQVGGSNTEPLPTESLSLTFTKVLVEYKEQKPDGSYGAPERAEWDFEKHKSS